MIRKALPHDGTVSTTSPGTAPRATRVLRGLNGRCSWPRPLGEQLPPGIAPRRRGHQSRREPRLVVAGPPRLSAAASSCSRSRYGQCPVTGGFSRHDAHVAADSPRDPPVSFFAAADELVTSGPNGAWVGARVCVCGGGRYRDLATRMNLS